MAQKVVLSGLSLLLLLCLLFLQEVRILGDQISNSNNTINIVNNIDVHNGAAGNTQEHTNEKAHSADVTGSVHNSTHHKVERYQVAKWDWIRIATPFIIGAWLVLAMVSKTVFHTHFWKVQLSTIVPESCLLIILGLILGFILYYNGVQGYEMDADVFFLYLLPPIILDSGYHMPNRAFFANFGSIFLFAFVGTIWNALLIGFSLWGFSYSGGIGAIKMDLNMLSCLLFGTLLAAVDPVAVLAVFEEVHVNEVLNIVVFAESLLNDGVTVVLYHLFEGLMEIDMYDHIQVVDVVSGVVSIVVVIVVSIIIGLGYGICAAFMTKFTEHVRVIEPMIVFTLGYLSYLTGELFHFSGIIACTSCGMFMQVYVEKNISLKSHTTIKYFMKTLAQASETIIFMLIGVSTVTRQHEWDTSFVLLTVLFCLVYRALGVIFGCLILNSRRLEPFSAVDQVIMAYGGLRGAIAFSLVLILEEELIVHKKIYLTTTVVVVYFTNLLMGSTIKPLVNMLRVKRNMKSKPSMNEKLNGRLVDHVMAGIEDIAGHYGDYELRQRFSVINNKILKPLLIREDHQHTRGRSLVNVYEKLTEKDASEFIRRNGSFYALQNPQSQANLPSVMTRTNSLAKMFALYTGYADDDEAMSSTDYYVKNNRLAPPGITASREFGSDHGYGGPTVLDMKAIEDKGAAIHRVDTSIHHLLDESMFQPRKRGKAYNKYMINETEEQPFHHKDRLRLRKMMSSRRKSNPNIKKGHKRAQSPAQEIIQEHNRNPDATIEMTVNCPPRKDSSCLSTSLPGNGDKNKPRKNVSFVFAEGEIPRDKPSVVKTTIDKHHPYSSRKKVVDTNQNNNGQPTNSPAKTTDSLPIRTPNGVLPPPRVRPMFSIDADSDSEEALKIKFTVTPPDEDPLSTLPWEQPSNREDTDDTDDEPVRSQSPTAVESTLPWKRDLDQLPLCSKHSKDPQDADIPTPSPQAHNWSMGEDQPRLSLDKLQKAAALEEDVMDPFDQDARSVEDGRSARDSSPARFSSPEQVEQDEPPAYSPPQAPDIHVDPIPPPWRDLQPGPVEVDDHHHSLSDSPRAMFHIPSGSSEASGSLEVKGSGSLDIRESHEIDGNGQPDQGARKMNNPNLPWRQMSMEDAPVRSPSVAQELDSMKPITSCYSGYMSEAESHHSMPMHYTPIIDTADPLGFRSHPHLPDMDTISDMVDQIPDDELNVHQRVTDWMSTCSPDLLLPVNDTEIVPLNEAVLPSTIVEESENLENELQPLISAWELGKLESDDGTLVDDKGLIVTKTVDTKERGDKVERTLARPTQLCGLKFAGLKHKAPHQHSYEPPQSNA